MPDGLHGKSLLPVLQDTSATIKESALSFTKGGTSLRTSRWAYMRYKDGTEELYDMRRDPEQFTNLASAAEHADTLKKLSAELNIRTEDFDDKKQ